jgi:DNA-binding transcriptional ArsR family regulator
MATQPHYVAYDADIAPIAALIADPTRAAMLTALLDGRPLAAGELAYLAGVSAATASAHLARLRGGGLVTVTRQGRHRYYRLAGPQVAGVIEAMAHISPRPAVRSLRQSREAAALQEARTCYDHLAGRAGVELLAALLATKVLAEKAGGSAPSGVRGYHPGSTVPPRSQRSPHGRSAGRSAGDGASPDPEQAFGAEFEITRSGAPTLAAFGINLGELRGSRRRFAGACLDWTQRRPHLNGALGAAITARLLDLGWFERGHSRRALRLTGAGREGLAETFGCVLGDGAG